MTGTPNTVTGLLVAALESTWAAIRARHPDVPEVVLAIASGSTPAGLNLGHFAPHRWVRGDYELHELFVGGEGLNRGPVEVLCTLLHEAAHGMAVTRGMKDTSRQGRWHNRRYRDLAVELGLTVDADPGHGWAVTSVSDITLIRYRPHLQELSLALIAYRHREPDISERGGGHNNGIAAVCSCGRRIRVAPSTFELGGITCAVCSSQFAAQGRSSNQEIGHALGTNAISPGKNRG
ncbi:hypothetical protein [Nocardia transvalensis]|uniref:hypothetical protein n=1 Tax=Nocardia transvalensis TaxID=37333 RepID=UPI001895F1C6|nr:hypothetical protein [Nocardia transvalensis]MBF6329795.1 hypothetical protein [Nocardia transvalensis]